MSTAKPKHIVLIGWADCGCASLIMHAIDKKDVARFHRIAKKRALRIEEADADPENLRSKVFECPEHRSLRLRAIERDKAKRALDHIETPGISSPGVAVPAGEVAR